MSAPSPEKLFILRETTAANAKHRHLRGSRNCWTAEAAPGPNLQALIDAGLMLPLKLLRPDSQMYIATADGMRAAGLTPSEIERCCKLRPETRA